MREIRLSGSEGGGIKFPLPLSFGHRRVEMEYHVIVSQAEEDRYLAGNRADIERPLDTVVGFQGGNHGVIHQRLGHFPRFFRSQCIVAKRRLKSASHAANRLLVRHQQESAGSKGRSFREKFFHGGLHSGSLTAPLPGQRKGRKGIRAGARSRGQSILRPDSIGSPTADGD